MSLDILQGYTGLGVAWPMPPFFGVSRISVGVSQCKGISQPYLGIELTAGILSAALTARHPRLIVLRSTGVYLLMILLASSMMLWGIAFKLALVGRSDDGLPGIARPDLSFIYLDLKHTTDFYYFILFFLVVGSALMYLVVRSSFRSYPARHTGERNAHEKPWV